MNLKRSLSTMLGALALLLAVPGSATAQSWIESVDFGAQLLGTVTEPQSFIIENDGAWPFTISPLTLRGTHADAFKVEADTCSNRQLQDGDACSFNVRFEARKTTGRYPGGLRKAELVISDDSGDAPSILRLSGSVLIPATLSAGALPASKFGTTPVGRRGVTRRMWYWSTGDFDASVGAMTIGGTGASQFALVGENTCSNRLIKPRAACYVDVQFRPKTVGTHYASLVAVGWDPAQVTTPLVGVADRTVAETLRRVARSAARKVTAKKLLAKRGQLALGRYRWPADGTVRASLSLIGKDGKRLLARSPGDGISAGDRSDLELVWRRGGRHALHGAGARPRLVVAVELTEPSGARTVGKRKLRLRGL